MNTAVPTLVAMAIVAKYVELLKAETTSLDDKITVERSMDLLSKAAADFIAELSESMAQMVEKKPKAEA